MASVLVNVAYDTTRQFRGKGISTKVDSKKSNAYFRTSVDDFTLEEALQEKDSNILVYMYEGTDDNPVYQGITDTSLNIIKRYDLGMDITEEDVKAVLESTPIGVSPLIRLPEEYKDFEFLVRMCEKYERVRFCGGVLFCDGSCRFGCCGKDTLSSNNIKVPDGDYIKEGCTCALKKIEEVDTELYPVEKSQRSTKSRTKTKSGSKPKEPKKKVKMFGNILGGQTVEL